MTSRRPLILGLALLLLVGCGVPRPTTPVAVQASTVRATLQSRLERLLDECLVAARGAATPVAAEAAALMVYERWKPGAGGESQFQVQAQPLRGGGFQVQLQAQLTMGQESLQAQRQLVVLSR